MSEAEEKKKESSLIDPIYTKFVRGVTRAIGSTEFYEFFMDSVSRAQNEFQFSNRKLIKRVDTTWVDAIEETLNAIQNVVSSPRNVIKEEDLIVNVANARKTGAETVRHLAQHSGLVESFDERSGDVRPAQLMQRYREESIGLYENRLVFTTIEQAYHFVMIRHNALFEAMSDEFGAKLKLKTDMESATEHVHLDMFLHIKEIDSALNTDKKNGEVFSRISRIYRLLSLYMNTPFAQQMAKMNRIKGTITKTNVLKKNKDYRTILKLFEFLRNYDDIGYTIKIVEQNPEINERFEQDIYRNILFNYLILKGYLEDEEDREIPTKARGRKRTLKPKFIHQIVEELTEDYDLPDVEIRKVLIEELTKEQLMQEEAAERRRLVEEQERLRKEEEARIKAEKKAEAERIKAEKAAEAERRRQEKEAEEARRLQEQRERDMDDRRRRRIFLKEIERFREQMETQISLREEAEKEAQKQFELEDYADAVKLMEEAERLKKEERARNRQRRKDEKERAEHERLLAEEKARQEKLEQEERLRREKEEEEARLAEEQRERDRVALRPYILTLDHFSEHLEEQKQLREEQKEQARIAQEARTMAKLLRAQQKNSQ